MPKNPRGPQDAVHVRTGKDGLIGIITDDGFAPLSESNEYRFTISFQNADWHPVGDPLVYGVPTGVSISLSITEATIRDDLIMAPILEALPESGLESSKMRFGFQTVLYGANGTQQRIKIDNCIPDGDVDITNITPGEIVQHAWTFRVNALPELLEKLGVNY